MTSWLRNAPPMPLTKKDSLIFEIAQGGFCSQFNNYLHAYLYARAEKETLHVNDMMNAVSVQYPLLQSTFKSPPDVKFVDAQVLSAVSTQRRQGPIRVLLNTTKSEELRALAREVFQWNRSLLEKLQPILDDAIFPAEFDVGVHLRTADTKPLSLELYTQAIRKYQQTSKKTALNIFVMTDSVLRLEELKKKCDPTWRVYSLNTPLLGTNGYSQQEFNNSPSRARMNAYLHFMAELYLVQMIPHIVCSFSSNVGRFLYLTMADGSTITSVDIPKFVAV